MAKAERNSNPFGWILLGALVGAIATAGVLLMASTMNFDRGYEDGPSEIRTAADDAATAAASRPTPVSAAPKPEQPAPVATVPAPAAAQPPVDAQMADDAAAAGMTSRASTEQQPTN
jgi:hypothetical protein